MDAGLLAAMMNVESGGRNGQTSSAGAAGLMQLMPGTAKDLGVTDPMDPEQNIYAGARYITMLLDKYKGDTELALAAYNWGMGNVDKAITKAGSRDWDDIAKYAPEETRKYVPKVLGKKGR